VFRVWAPAARSVALHVNDGRHAMARSGGWWEATLPVANGALYGFIIDGDGPFPDPRSRWQPFGVHGLSQFIEDRSFAWTDTGWQAAPIASGVIYELHIGTFSEPGTFAGAIAKLPELIDLGITHVEIMPVAEFSGERGWGYDGVDLFAPHHAYGQPDDLKRLVDACHAYGLAVILDVVYNHLGPAGNYLGKFGPYFTNRHVTPWGDAINLDGPFSDEVRRFFCDNAVMWLREYHFDGLRLDAIHALVDLSGTHFLEQLAQEIEILEATVGRHFVLIAESDLNDPRVVASREAGGYGLHAQWSDDFHHALHALITGERAGYYEDFGGCATMATALKQPFVHAGAHSTHRRRTHGRAQHGLAGSRFVVAAQNHDQVGNRAGGERLVHLTTPGRAKVAAALLLCAPFVPLVFQGEEWGASTPFLYFTAHDAELGRRVSEGRRNEFAAFGWRPEVIPDPQAVETFVRSRLRWDEREEPRHAELLAWYRSLIALRRARPSLSDGRYDDVSVRMGPRDGTFTLQRGEIDVVCNLSPQPVSIACRDTPELLLGSTRDIQLLAGTVRVPPDAVAIVAPAA
jgi:maltooligosyltrehalose trehalohydrolase